MPDLGAVLGGGEEAVDEMLNEEDALETLLEDALEEETAEGDEKEAEDDKKKGEGGPSAGKSMTGVCDPCYSVSCFSVL